MSHSPDTFDPHGIQKPGAGETIDAMRAYKVVFNSENWFVDILLVLVCLMIPIVGPIVVLGYEMELIEGWLKQPNKPHARLDFGRFMDYLKRGVWPFVAMMIGQLVLLPLSMILCIPFVCFLFGGAALMEENEGLGLVCILAGYAVVLVGSLLLNVVGMCIITPMKLGAGLAGEVGPAIDFAYIKDFIRRTWKEMAKAFFMFMVIGMFTSVLGCFVFCIGIYFAAAWMWLAMAHLNYQTYALYLARGGKPIQPKVEMAGSP